MPRQITETRTLYLYSELSDSAKERARQWYTEASAGGESWSESTIDDFVTIAAACGWQVAMRSRRLPSGLEIPLPRVLFSGFWSQGDGACFEGEWAASRVNPAVLREHAPLDTDLHAIADEFARLAALEPTATATSTHSGLYCHARSVTVSADTPRDDLGPSWIEWERQLTDATADLSDWLYQQLERDYEYHFNGDGLAETMEANGYTFLSDGRRYGRSRTPSRKDPTP